MEFESKGYELFKGVIVFRNRLMGFVLLHAVQCAVAGFVQCCIALNIYGCVVGSFFNHRMPYTVKRNNKFNRGFF